MAIRMRETATRFAHHVLKSKELTREELGELYNNGRRLTEKQLERFKVLYDKIVSKLGERVAKYDAKAKEKAKGTKSKPQAKKAPAIAKKSKGKK